MTRILLSFAIAVLLFGSCADHNIINNEHNPNTCNVGDPVRDLAWLASMIEEMEQSSIREYVYVKQSTHQGQTVFITANCCPFCGSIFNVYNCQGERIGSVGDKQFDTKLSQRAKVIWKATASSCTF